MIWVIDASVAVHWFLEDETHSHADAVLRRLIDRPELFAVPELFCFEVFSLLCRIHPRGRDVYINGMIPVINGGMLRQPVTETLVNGAARYVEMGLTCYDACYAALAMELKGSWLTFDEKAHHAIEEEGLSHNLFAGLPERWE